MRYTRDVERLGNGRDPVVVAQVGRRHAVQVVDELARRHGPEQAEQQKPCSPVPTTVTAAQH